VKTKKKNPDLNEIVFEDRNKEYGAYILRKLYSKYVTLSTTGAMILFTLIASYPLITAFFVQENNDTKSNGNVKVIILKIFLQKYQLLKKICKFLKLILQNSLNQIMVPDVKPDALVTNEVIPTQQELSGKILGSRRLKEISMEQM